MNRIWTMRRNCALRRRFSFSIVKLNTRNWPSHGNLGLIPFMGSSPNFSFEFFPPKGPNGAMRLWRSVERLAPMGPSFVSVTYGAGGSTRERTVAAIHNGEAPSARGFVVDLEGI